MIHTHTQSTPSDTWTINHGLYKNPLVSVRISGTNGLEQCIPFSIEFPSNTQVLVKFTSPRSGEATLA